MAKAEAEPWCGPTRELERTELLKLVHASKPEPPKAKDRIDEDAWFCKTSEVPASTKELSGPVVIAPASSTPAASAYPVYQRSSSVGIAISVAVLAMIAICVLMTIAV